MQFHVPQRSVDQRMEALARGNEVRVHRSRLKARLKTGEASFQPLLLGHDDPLLDTMKVQELLLAVPGVGPTKVRRVLKGAGVSPSKSLAGLTNHQRLRLLAELQTFPAVRRLLA